MTPQAALDKLAREMDEVLARLERAGMSQCPPKLNEEESAATWLARPGSPKPGLDDEKPPGETVPYEELLSAWREGRVR